MNEKPYIRRCELCSGNGLIEVLPINGARVGRAEFTDRILSGKAKMPPPGDSQLQRASRPSASAFVRCPCSAGERFKQFQPFDAKWMEPAAGAAFRKQKADAE